MHMKTVQNKELNEKDEERSKPRSPFQAGCDEIWEKICSVQGKDPSVDFTQVRGRGCVECPEVWLQSYLRGVCVVLCVVLGDS